MLAPDERVISWAETEAGVLVATPRGLWWPEDETHRRIGWHLISKAVWNEGVLTVTQADIEDDLMLIDRPAVSVSVTTPRDLPPTIRKRVEANIVHTEQVAVRGGTASLVARYVPGEDGLHWWARLSAGAMDDGSVRHALSARLALLQADWAARHSSL